MLGRVIAPTRLRYSVTAGNGIAFICRRKQPCPPKETGGDKSPRQETKTPPGFEQPAEFEALPPL